MTKIPQVVQKEFQSLAPQVAEGLGMLLGAEVTIDLSEARIIPGREFLTEVGGNGISCRSQFVLSSSGIGGIFLQDRAAQVFGAKILFMDVPEEGTPIVFEEQREALEEIFNVFIGAWNRAASTEFRMSTKVDERAVERWEGLEAFPPLSGVFPMVLVSKLTIDDHVSDMGIYLPLKHCSHLNREQFTPPERFHLCSIEPGGEGDTSGGGGGGESPESTQAQPAETGTATAVAERKATKIVIVDDAQLLSQIIREYTAAGTWELVRNQQPERDPAVPAGILVLGNPAEITELLDPSHLVHLRAKEGGGE